MSISGHEAVAAYLKRLKQALRFLPAEERSAIISEIESHIADRVASGPADIFDTLEKLGDPEDLAQAYIEQFRLEGALARSENARLLLTLLERGTRSLVALATGLAALILDAFALAFAAIAVLKPVLPQHVGLWVGNGVFDMGILDQAPDGVQELLGYGIIPVAAVCCVLCFLAGRTLMRMGARMLLRKTKTPRYA